MVAWNRRVTFLIGAIGLLTGGISACSASTGGEEVHLAMMPLEAMPSYVQNVASPVVQEAYQFSAANPDILKTIPCYCGCRGIGHVSNYDCYVSDIGADGKIVFDNHALACSICVNITQDVMRLLKKGKSVEEARAYIVSTYSSYESRTTP